MCSLEKRGPVHVLTLTGPNSEHRLNPPLLTSLISILTQLKSYSSSSSSSSSCAALVLAGEGKFFSNGFDLDWANQDNQFATRGPYLSSLLEQTTALLLSLPFPTVAAVTGHAAAAGMMLALSCDYVVMRADRGVLYLPETDIGLVIPNYFIEIVRSKVGSKAMKEMVLGGKKVTAEIGVEMGMVDKAVVGVAETIEEAVKLGKSLADKKWDGKVYAKNRMAMLPQICGAVGLMETQSKI